MTTSVSPTRLSRYLEYLPAVFQEATDPRGVTFVGRFLLAFERILHGLGDSAQPGLEEIIERAHTYFDPVPDKPDTLRAPEEFLPWLASWVAVSLREDWEPEEKRRFISEIVPAYRMRGTKAGLKRILEAYTGRLPVTITEPEHKDYQPHYFKVEVFLGVRDPDLLKRKEQIAKAIIDQEKPAHSYYALETLVPTLRIGYHSKVGMDTLLGTPE